MKSIFVLLTFCFVLSAAVAEPIVTDIGNLDPVTVIDQDSDAVSTAIINSDISVVLAGTGNELTFLYIIDSPVAPDHLEKNVDSGQPRIKPGARASLKPIDIYPGVISLNRLWYI